MDEQIDDDIIKNNAVEERMKNLSKAKIEAENKTKEAETARAEADAKVLASQKEVEFYSSFSDSISKFPNASEYKDKIKEKVMSGYSVEDATVAILHAEGKLTTPPTPRQPVAGGSAPNQLSQGGVKTINEMSREDKRAAVLEAMDKGDISLS